MDTEPISDQQVTDCIHAMWNDAFEQRPFDAVCTLLRVDGLQDAGWDPFAESVEAFEDFNWHLKAEDDALSPKAAWRVGLLMYCQAVEMSAVHSTIANLLRILLAQPYHINPLGSLGRADKKRMFKWYPPSAKAKWKKLRDMAVEARREDLILLMDNVYNDAVRNAFSHSDYIIADEQFRWTEGGLPSQLSLEEVSNLISNAFSFFGLFMGIRDQWLALAGKMPRYHKWPEHEVLELLRDDEQKLTGFHVHFSNGSKARFARTEEGVDCTNLTIDGDGTINFMVGFIDQLEPVWKIDGVAVDFGDKNSIDEL